MHFIGRVLVCCFLELVDKPAPQKDKQLLLSHNILKSEKEAYSATRHFRLLPSGASRQG